MATLFVFVICNLYSVIQSAITIIELEIKVWNSCLKYILYGVCIMHKVCEILNHILSHLLY